MGTSSDGVPDIVPAYTRRCDSIGHIKVQAVKDDQLAQVLAISECITDFRDRWFNILGVDQFNRESVPDPLDYRDKDGMMYTELDVYVEFGSTQVRGRTHVVRVSPAYIAMYPVASLAATIRYQFHIELDTDFTPLFIARRGDGPQPTAVYVVYDADWAAWLLLSLRS